MLGLNALEPDETPPARQGIRKLLEQIFHGFMLLLALVLVFAISGAALFLFLCRNREFASNVTVTVAWIVFCMGGMLGLILTIRCYFSKPEEPPKL